MNNKTYQRWLKKAQEDLKWTEVSIQGGIWYGACFTAHQAAEKALKAVLLRHNKKSPKIHSLVALLEECLKQDKEFEKLRVECAKLTVYYGPTRYPDLGDFSEFSEERAREALIFAQTIVEFVEKKLE